MIREKAIFIKLNQLKLSDQQIFDAVVNGFKPSRCICPVCKAAGRFKEILPYRRCMISVCDGARTEAVVNISRFQCESCGHTHALLPDVLIPYGSYTLRFILAILMDYLNRKGTVTELCGKWQIAVSTLYSWIHLFIDQYNAWCRILDRILWVSESSVQTVRNADALPAAFFSLFGFSFLQKPGTSLTDPSPAGDRRRKTRPA